MRIGRFLQDKRGTSFEGIALSVSIMAVAFVASADMLDFMTKPSTITAFNPIAARPATLASGNLDEMPTASLPELASHSVLDPCTGRVKSQ